MVSASVSMKAMYETGRTSMGVRGINLTGDDEVIGMQLDRRRSITDRIHQMVWVNVLNLMNLQHSIVVVKVSSATRLQKTGDVVGVKAVNEDNEIMIITTEGNYYSNSSRFYFYAWKKYFRS